MEKDRSARLTENLDANEILSQVTILHHTDSMLARKITKAILVERADRGDFRDPVLNLTPTEDGVIHVVV